MSQAPRTSYDQLKAALDAGVIDQATFDAATLALNAQQTDSGAIARGQDSLAVGAGGVAVTGDNNGTINLGVLIQQGTRPGAGRVALKRAYLARILIRANQLPLFAGASGKKAVRLSSVYTALLTARNEFDAITPQLMGDSPERNSKKLSALDVLNAEKMLVLLGGPGSGKSTFINFVALAMAGELLGHTALNLATLTAPLPKEEDDDDKEPQPQRWDHKALLPVQVTLRDFASQLPPPGTPLNADTVCSYLKKQLEQAALNDFFPLLHEEMIGGRALILLDGLDEVPDALDRRAQIKQAVQDFAATFSRCRFLVTSRTYAYQRQDWKLDGFAEVHLLPFTHGQSQHFIRTWYQHMAEI
jgi:predicted NACHT family NTPase